MAGERRPRGKWPIEKRLMEKRPKEKMVNGKMAEG